MVDRTGADLAQLTQLTRLRAAAEASEWSQMLRVAEQLEADAALLVGERRRDLAVSAIPLEISTATGWSEAQVQNRLSAAARVRRCAPATWLAFQDGRIDAARATAIAGALFRLRRRESHAELDQTVVAYAVSHTVGELRRWLTRFVARAEPESTAARAEDERAGRHVRITHGDDAMAWVMAYVPSIAAEAIDRRLTRRARKLQGDERTLDQRRADLFMAWLTTADATEVQVGADVAVVVPAEVLAGASDDLAVAQDGSWVTPASWLLDYASADRVFWHRLLTDEAGGVLDHTYLGRFAPDQLDTALRFRDRVCRAPGCTTPARLCDQDHLVPWPEGPTSAENLGALCRRHHRMKSHAILTWSLPSGQQVPADRHAHAPPRRPVSSLEHRVATAIVEFAA